MEIVRKVTPERVPFSSLTGGEAFDYSGVGYVKLVPNGLTSITWHFNAAALNTGIVYVVGADTLVLPLNAKVVSEI